MPSESLGTDGNKKPKQEHINLVLCQANEIANALYYFKVKSREIHMRIQNHMASLKLYTELYAQKRENSSEDFIKAVKDLSTELKKVTIVIAEVRKLSNSEMPLSNIKKPNKKQTLLKLQALTNALFYKNLHFKWCSGWMKTEKLQQKAISDLFSTILQEEAIVQQSSAKQKNGTSLSDAIGEMNAMIQKLSFKSDDVSASKPKMFSQTCEAGSINNQTTNNNDTKPQTRRTGNLKASFGATIRSSNVPTATEKTSSRVEPPHKEFTSKPANVNELDKTQVNGLTSNPTVYIFGAKTMSSDVSAPTQASQESSEPLITPITKLFEAKPTISNSVNSSNTQSPGKSASKSDRPLFETFESKPENINSTSHNPRANCPTNPRIYLFGQEPKISDVTTYGQTSQESSKQNNLQKKPMAKPCEAKPTSHSVSSTPTQASEKSTKSGLPSFKVFNSKPENIKETTNDPKTNGLNNPRVYMFGQEPKISEHTFKEHSLKNKENEPEPKKCEPKPGNVNNETSRSAHQNNPEVYLFGAEQKISGKHISKESPLKFELLFEPKQTNMDGTSKPQADPSVYIFGVKPNFGEKSDESAPEQTLQDAMNKPLLKPVRVIRKASQRHASTQQATSSDFLIDYASGMGTAYVKFIPPCGSELVYRAGQTSYVDVRYQYITLIKFFANKSVEELRFEDYLGGRKGPTPNLFYSQSETTTTNQAPGNAWNTTQNSETPTQFRQESIQKKVSPTKNIETTAQHRETPTQFHEASTQNKDEPTWNGKITKQHKETLKQFHEVPTLKRETPTKNGETTQHRENPTQFCNAPSQKAETRIPNGEKTTQHPETPPQHREIPTQHREIPTQHRETPSQHRETPSQYHEAPTQKTDTPSHKDTIRQYWDEISTLQRRVLDENDAELERLLEGQIRETIKLCNDNLSLNPEDVFYLEYRARGYYELKRYRNALEDAQKAASLAPNMSAICYLTIAKCCLALGQIAPGEQAVRRAAERDPAVEVEELNNAFEQLRIKQERIHRCITQQHYYDAVILIDHCLQRYCPASSTMKLMKAECLAHMRKYEEARSIVIDLSLLCTNAQSSDAVYADAMYVTGLCSYYQENDELATKHFRKALEHDPDHEKAIKMFKLTKTRINTKRIKQKKEQGNKAFNAGEWRKAMNFYDEALTIDKSNIEENAKLHYNRATVFAKQNQLMNAIRACTAALELDGNYIKALLRRAQCYKDIDMYEESLDDYEKLYYIDSTEENRRLLDEAHSALKDNEGPYYYYKVLGIDKNASQDDIKKAYKRCALRYHPDKHASAAPAELRQNERKFKLMKEAYDTLRDPRARHNYDRKRRCHSSSSDEYENQFFW